MTWLLGLGAALCLFLGFWAFVYQGYKEDYGSQPLQTWPYGVALFAAAGLLITLIIRRVRPALSRRGLALSVIALALLLFLAALGSIDAGGNSVEF